jgi:E3 ubiquitin-protein ligase listerin
VESEFRPDRLTEDSDEDEAGEEGGDSDDEKISTNKVVDDSPRTSIAFRDFLQFLELGCGGSPIEGYPTIIIILSTIPSTVKLSIFRLVSQSLSSCLDNFSE